MALTKQQEFIKFLNGLELKRYMQIREACLNNNELPFCKESWSKFMCNVWQINTEHFKLMWKIVDETYK